MLVLTGLVPDLWPFILATLVIGIVIYLPHGLSDGTKIIGLPKSNKLPEFLQKFKP